MGAKPNSAESMKQRVNRCLLKLGDRDTEAMAAAELDGIAVSLNADELAGFLSAISDARPTDKTPLRRHSLRLLSLLAGSHPPAAVAPLLPRVLSAALRRLRDPDSSVRAALVAASATAASAAAAAGGGAAAVSSVLRPLSDALLHEQDASAQLAAALSLAAAVDASAAGGATGDLAAYLHKLLPRLLKLLRSNAFKAKAALISLVGAAAAASDAAAAAIAGNVVHCLVEALRSEDWAARKAAAEALTAIALSDKEALVGFKASCVASFESRRYDKVKIVRESMNRMIEVWKEIPEAADENNGSDAPPPASSNSQPRSCRGGESASDGRYPAASLGYNAVPSVTRRTKSPSSRSPPPDASPIVTNRKISPSIRNKKLSPPPFRKTDQTKNSDWHVEIPALNATPIKVVTEEKLLKDRRQEELGGNVRARLEARRMLFQKNCEEKVNKLPGLKSGSRVVPFEGDVSLGQIVEVEDRSEELQSGHKDEDLSKIRMQLVQIENQQTSLLDLLQKFIGTSQNGIHSLETRVHGLEMALDEISRDLAASSGRMSNSDQDANTCCILSPKFWRRHEGRYSSRFSISDAQNFSEESRSSYKWDRQRFGPQGGFVTNPLAEANTSSVGSTDIPRNDTGRLHSQDGRKQDFVSQKPRTG